MVHDTTESNRAICAVQKHDLLFSNQEIRPLNMLSTLHSHLVRIYPTDTDSFY